MATQTLIAPVELQLPAGDYTPEQLRQRCPKARFDDPSGANPLFTVQGTVEGPTGAINVPSAATPGAATITCRYIINGPSPVADTQSPSTSLTTTASPANSQPLVTPESTASSKTTGTLPSPIPSNGTAHNNHGNSNGVSPGVAAGIGIGLAIIGILIGAAAAWWFFARRRGRQPAGSDMSTDKTGISLVTDPGPPNKGHLVAAGGPRGLSGAGTTAGGVGSLDFYLLDGVGDSEITSDLNALSHLIKDHVESNYHLRPIQLNATSIMESLSGLGLNDHTQSQIATLALDTRTRHFAIRSLLVRVIFSALDIHSVGDLSLLPPSMAAFVQALPPTSSFKNSGLPTAKALDTWRRLSVYLLHEKREERTQLPPPAAIHSQIKSLLNALDRFLQHFVYDDNRARSDQARNLEGVISECIGVGYAVLSHPTEMRYTFHSRSNKSAVVVLPGIERLSSRNGEAYTTPQVVAWPETVNV